MALVTNLLINGDFSQSSEGWTIHPDIEENGNKTSAVIVPGSTTSKPYLKLSDSTGNKHYIVEQKVTVKPSTCYYLVANTFYLQGRGKIWRKRQKTDAAKSSNTTQNVQTYNTEQIDETEIKTNWSTHFFTEENVSELIIAFACVSDSASQEFIYGINNVFLYEKNLVQNADFSDTNVVWNLQDTQDHNGKAQIIPEFNGSSNLILQLTLGAQASQTITDIQPSTEYRLLFRNSNPYSGNGKIEVIPIVDSQNYQNQDWEYKTIEFTTNYDTSEITIHLSSATTAQFDDFSLAPIKRAAQL